nr:hypothetical protein [Ornithobacterium rhinotracheale]
MIYTKNSNNPASHAHGPMLLIESNELLGMNKGISNATDPPNHVQSP